MTTIKEAGTFTADGSNALIQVITPGIGSSGTYSAEVIERAATDRVFKRGTPMFVDHATDNEDWERPEGSLTRLAGVLTEDARWNGEALVANARIFENWKPTLTDMAEHIGVSIRATAEAADTADGPVIERITRALSIDFVTQAGRGGRILDVLESKRDTDSTTNVLVEVTEALTDQETPEQTNPAPAGKEPHTDSQEGTVMGDITLTESAHTELVEKASRVDMLEAELNTIKEAQAREARTKHVTQLVNTEFAGVEDTADVAGLLIERFAATDTDDATIVAEAKDRAGKLAPASPVKGMGESRPVTESKTDVTEADILAALKGA